MAQLKRIYGVTVDLRLRQFRRIDDTHMDFIPFSDERGDRLLARMIRYEKLGDLEIRDL